MIRLKNVTPVLCFLLTGAVLLRAAPEDDQFQGSIPTGAATGAPLALTLHGAIERGLKTNLGVVSRETGNQVARAERIRALSSLLPRVTGSAGITEEQVNLKTFGFSFPAIPGFPGIPTIVGPFHYVDAHATASMSLFDYTARKNWRAAQANEEAVHLTYQDGRDLVVQAVANAYLLIIADGSRVDSIHAQVKTAQALYDRAVDQKNAGTSPAIDVLRAQVELKRQQQRQLAEENQLAKDKLSLGRVIGLPNGQDFNLAEQTPFQPLEKMTPEDAEGVAYKQRADYRSAQRQVYAAEQALKGARGEWLPTAGVNATYGANGLTPTDSHGVFTVAASLNFNIFDGGRIKADVEQARASLKEKQDALADLSGKINFQIRSALLDIQSAGDQVQVAQSNVDLAAQTLDQARDRFAAGVADTIEVVQAQESVAAANDDLIAALYVHNSAKVSLARSLGSVEQGIDKFLAVK